MAKALKLPDNRVQKLLKKAMRGVAPQEHDKHYDLSLLVDFQNGDLEAAMILAESYADVFSVIMNKPAKPPHRSKAMQKLWSEPTFQDKEDLFQEILFHFLKMAKEFDMEKPEPFVYKVRATLHQRVFNQFFSEFLEIKKVENSYEEAIHGELVEPSILIDEEITSKVPAQYIELYQAMNQLGKRQRQVIELSVMKGWNSKEVAEEIGISANTVRPTLKKALDNLKKIMGA